MKSNAFLNLPQKIIYIYLHVYTISNKKIEATFSFSAFMKIVLRSVTYFVYIQKIMRQQFSRKWSILIHCQGYKILKLLKTSLLLIFQSTIKGNSEINGKVNLTVPKCLKRIALI